MTPMTCFITATLSSEKPHAMAELTVQAAPDGQTLFMASRARYS